SKDYLQRWRAYQEEFGEDLDIVVVVQGSDRGRMRQAVDRLAEQFQAHPGQFDRVFHRVDLKPLQNRALLYLPTEQIRQIQGHLQGMRLLLELGPLGWRNLSLAGLLAEAEQRLQNAPTGSLSPADGTFFA